MGRKHHGNEWQALQLIVETLSDGGAANYLKLLEGVQAPSSPMKRVAAAFDRYPPAVYRTALTRSCRMSQVMMRFSIECMALYIVRPMYQVIIRRSLVHIVEALSQMSYFHPRD